jgi:hypothetical protein
LYDEPYYLDFFCHQVAKFRPKKKKKKRDWILILLNKFKNINKQINIEKNIKIFFGQIFCILVTNKKWGGANDTKDFFYWKKNKRGGGRQSCHIMREKKSEVTIFR